MILITNYNYATSAYRQSSITMYNYERYAYFGFATVALGPPTGSTPEGSCCVAVF